MTRLSHGDRVRHGGLDLRLEVGLGLEVVGDAQQHLVEHTAGLARPDHVDEDGGEDFGCLAIESESDCPASTSRPTWAMTSRSTALSVCVARMLRHFVSDRPALIIVANWRAKIVTSFGLTRPPPILNEATADFSSRLTMM